MQRRDAAKFLLVSAVGGELPDAHPAPTTDLQSALQAPGKVRIAVGTHSVTSKLRTTLPNNIAGASRNETILVPAGFADYVLEVGDGRSSPNAGRIERLRFYGAPGNLGCLHMSSLAHMWRLEDLIFSGGPCPAIVVDDCWDSNYTDIDILGHVTPGNDPAKTAAVIFRGSTNNIYCRGLRIEGALSGGIYAAGGPIYVVTGKIDDGFGGPQSAAAITIAATGQLVLEDFYFGGMRDQFHIDLAGHLKLGRVFFDGGTNRPAAIYDHRRWFHVNAASHPDFSSSATGPQLPILDLGAAEFRRVHASVEMTTAAAVYSRIHPIRQIQNLGTVSNGVVRGNTIVVGSSLHALHDNLYRDSYLVHNTSRTRRRILKSFTNGELLLEGTRSVTLDADWSIEYCQSHDTPIRHENAWLAPGQTLFAVVSPRLRIASTPTYVGMSSDPAYGTTKFKVVGDKLAPGQDVSGLFLINNITGQAYYIQYGLDEVASLGVIYDQRDALTAVDEFSIVAGYVGPAQKATPRLVRLVLTSSSTAPDLSAGSQFEVEVLTQKPFTVAQPPAAAGQPGHRLSLTFINSARGALGEVTWDGTYKLAPWVSPAPGHSRSIEFRYNGKSWVEVTRTPMDVPYA